MPAPLDDLAMLTASRNVLTEAELQAEVAMLGPRWSIAGENLRLELKGAMTRTGKVAAFVGALADEMDHHPSVVLEYAGLTLTIHTHDKHAITVVDLVFAARLEQWLRTEGWD